MKIAIIGIVSSTRCYYRYNTPTTKEMKIKTRGEEIDITLGTRFIEVYAGSKYGPVTFMEATSDPVIKEDMVSWMARNIVTGEVVRYGVNLKHWQYSPALCMIDSAVFNEKIVPFRP